MAELQGPKLSLCSMSAPSPMRQRSKTLGSIDCKSRKKKRKSATPIAQKSSSHMHKFKERSIPRKLGPRDIGRNKYRAGTKLQQTQTYGTFLDEKIHRHALGSSFLARKTKNPVQKNETVQETGTPFDWKKPQYYKSEVQKMYSYHNGKRQGWGGSMNFLTEKPSKPHDVRLEALKDLKIPKGKAVSEYRSPHSWTPIAYQYENKGGGFLDEKFWFEASHVQIDGGLSRLIEALAPKQKLQLNKMASPTGYQSKINFLKMLRDLVVIEIQRMTKEDDMLKKMESEAFIDGISKELEQEFEQQLDEALEEVLHDSEEEHKQTETDHNDMPADEDKKEDIVLSVIYDNQQEQSDHDMDEDGNGNESSLEGKFNNLVRRKKSDMGMLQRQILTLQSVNKLSDLIEGMEKQVVLL